VRGVVSLFMRPKNFSESVSGPATMVAATNYALKEGVGRVLYLAAILSIAVGIFNLLPFAPLDGGQIMVGIVEMLRRGKRLSMQIQETVSMVGFLLIIALVLSAWFFDFRRWFAPNTQDIPQYDRGLPEETPQPEPTP
jgi:regulator of sigma E protease